MALPEERIAQLEREIKQRFDAFNRQVEANLGRFVTTEGFDFLSLQNGYRREVQNFAAQLVNVFVLGGQITAVDASRQLGQTVAFDPSDATALLAFTELKTRVMQGLLQQQAEALDEFRRAAEEVIPIRTVAAIRQSLTLTGRQVKATNNFRRLLESNSADALERQLRDRRFDPTIRRAIDLNEPLTTAQIDRMVDRYRARQLDFRARTIAATEAVRIANEADMTFFQQLVARGDVDESQLTRRWVTSKDDKVRQSHRVLDGVPRRLNDPWISGNGSTLRFPGDPRAPARDTINCRCWVSTNVQRKPVQREIAA